MLYINDVVMTDPGDAPYLPDLQKGLFLNFNAALDAPGNGTPVVSIAMRHHADATPGDYTFNNVRGTGTTKPVSVGGAQPYLRFDGSNTLSNSSSTATAIATAFTVALRMRITNWATLRGNNGLFRGVPNRTVALRGGSLGNLEAAGGATNAQWTGFSSGMIENEWGVVVVAYDDINGDKVLSGLGNAASIAIADGASIKGTGFGANTETTGAAGAFDLSHFAIWRRALSTQEMAAVRDTWNQWRDINA